VIVWYLPFNCDLDIELTHGQHGFCTSPCWGEHFSQVWRKWCRINRADTIMETDRRNGQKYGQTKLIHYSPPPTLWWGYKKTINLMQHQAYNSKSLTYNNLFTSKQSLVNLILYGQYLNRLETNYVQKIFTRKTPISVVWWIFMAHINRIIFNCLFLELMCLFKCQSKNTKTVLIRCQAIVLRQLSHWDLCQLKILLYSFETHLSRKIKLQTENNDGFVQ